MPSLTHILETTLLVLVAYLLGCTIGYVVHRVLHAGRGTRQVTAATSPSPAPETAIQRPRRTMTAAARLAAAVSDEPGPRPARIDPAAPPSPGPRPAAMGRPRGSGAGDLRQIKGIGPKIEAALNGLGVYHIDQIAAWSQPNVDWVDHHLALKGRIGRERWVEQARAMVSITRLSA